MDKWDKLADYDFGRIANALELFNRHFFAAIDFHLQQAKGEQMAAITGVQAGSSDFFTASLIPANAVALQSGPVFSTDDTQVLLTQDTANPFKVTAAVGAGDTAASFNLKIDGVNSVGTAITHTFAIPITKAPPPVAVDFDLSQGA